MKINTGSHVRPRKAFTLLAVSGFLLGTLAIGSCRTRVLRQPRELTAVRTLAGSDREFGEPFGIAVRNGLVYLSDGQNGRILQVTTGGSISVFADGLDTPSGIAFDKNGDLLVADSGANSIRKIDGSGKLTTIAGTDGQRGYADGQAAAALFDGPIGIAAADDGTVYVADTYNDRIRVIRDGVVSTLAGNGRGFADGPGAFAKFDTPCGLALTNDGELLVADFGNRRLRVVRQDGSATTIAGTGLRERRSGLLGSADLVGPAAVAVDQAGSIFIADGNMVRVITPGPFPFLQTIAGGRRGLRDGDARTAEFNRPSGLAIDPKGNVFIADSDDRLVRTLSSGDIGREITPAEVEKLRVNAAEFRAAAPARWPYDPPDAKREIAGTLGELRGEIRPGDDDIHFHNGLDIAGSYGETARFVRDEKVLLPLAVDNFGTLREMIRMPTMGYIHIRIGRDSNEKPFGDPRFQFDGTGKLTDLRVPRGSKFTAGEPIGTLNPMNHVHLIAGPSGDEMNALDALILPGISDSRPPAIDSVSLVTSSGTVVETKSGQARIQITDKTRILVRAYDQVDGNPDRRRLGVYQAGFQLLRQDETPVGDIQWAIKFDRLPPSETVRCVYGEGSKSGATGETIFNYVVTNQIDENGCREGSLDPASLPNGNYILRAIAADYFGNQKTFDVPFEVKK